MIVGGLSLVAAFAQGQTLPTWVDDIAPIVHTHCAHCHHNGGAGPFPLVTYEDLVFGTIEEEVDRVTESPVLKGFKVWPTLASDVLSWRHDEPGALSALVRNAEGACCWSGTLEPGVTRLDVSSWPAGTYVMQVGGIDKRASRTWIKQ